MFKKDIGSIPRIAQTLTGHLPKAMDDELQGLIAAAEMGKDMTIEIIDLFAEHETTRAWMREQADSLNRGMGEGSQYSGLAGNPSVPISQRWVCPQKPSEHWLMVIQEGEPPPVCRFDGQRMARGS